MSLKSCCHALIGCQIITEFSLKQGKEGELMLIKML